MILQGNLWERLMPTNRRENKDCADNSSGNGRISAPSWEATEKPVLCPLFRSGVTRLREPTPPTILIVDDESEIRELIRVHVEQHGMRALEADCGSAAIEVLRRQDVDLIVLDLMMDESSGFEVLHHLRDERIDTLVIVASALRKVTDKVETLGLGADDYVTKPFSPIELIARIQANLRRYGRLSFPDDRTIRRNDFVLDLANLELRKGKETLSLTPTESSILFTLMRHPDEVLTRSDISRNVWNHDHVEASTINVYINQLRKKIEENPGRPVHIQTVRGVGYRFATGAS